MKKNEEYKLVKCYAEDGSFCVMFDFGDNLLYDFSDKSIPITTDSHQKIETLEQKDTLQEVVDFLNEDEYIEISKDFSGAFFDKLGVEIKEFDDKTELLEHIRKPKLKEITPDELAEMGYKIKEDGE